MCSRMYGNGLMINEVRSSCVHNGNAGAGLMCAEFSAPCVQHCSKHGAFLSYNHCSTDVGYLWTLSAMYHSFGFSRTTMACLVIVSNSIRNGCRLIFISWGLLADELRAFYSHGWTRTSWNIEIRMLCKILLRIGIYFERSGYVMVNTIL